MSIYKYNILNPVTDKHKPHYVEKVIGLFFLLLNDIDIMLK